MENNETTYSRLLGLQMRNSTTAATKAIQKMVFAIALSLLVPVHAIAQTLQQGISFYNQRQYKEALNVFTEIIKSGKADANAYYYCGLCYHQLKDYGEAKSMYRQVISAFPRSSACSSAQSALDSFSRGSSGSSDNSTPSESKHNGRSSRETSEAGDEQGSPTDSLPDQSSVYFEKGPGGHLIIDAFVNGHPLKMMFDTGASGSFFGKNHLVSAGIRPPEGKPTGMSQGVAGLTPTWETSVDIRVGEIRKRLHVGVEEHLNADPLLGQDFFRGYQYQIDNGGHRIVFTRVKQGGYTANNDKYAVPFFMNGGEMWVTIERRGRKAPAIFDTGAGSNVLTPQTAAALGIEIPPDAEPTTHGGIGSGVRRGYRFTIDELQLGGYIKKNCVVDVVNTEISLVGQPFFSDARYTIDNGAHLIRFFH